MPAVTHKAVTYVQKNIWGKQTNKGTRTFSQGKKKIGKIPGFLF